MKLLLALLFTVEAFAGAGTFPQGDSVKLLRDKMKFKTGRTIESNDVDPQSVATPADSGSILINDNGVFHKDDDGLTTNWTKLEPELPAIASEGGNFLYTNGVVKSWLDIDDRTNLAKDNLIECAGFQGCGSSEWVVVTDASLGSDSGTAGRLLEVGANNTGILNISGFAIPAADYDINATLTKTTGDYEGKQMVARCEIRTARPDVKFQTLVDGVVQSELDVKDDNTWTYYEIPLVGGATSVAMRVDGDTTASQEIIKIDNCYLGKKTVAQELGQAHFVGSLRHNTIASCIWVNTASSWANFAVDNDCTSQSIVGSVAKTATNLPSVDIPNPRTDGYYKITVNGMFYLGAGTNGNFRLSDGTSSGGFSSTVTTADSRVSSSLSAQFRFNDTATKTIQIQSRVTAGTAQINSDNSDRVLEFNVYFYPDDTSTVVTQTSQLDPEKAGFITYSAGNIPESQTWKVANGQCLLKADFPDYMRNVGIQHGECTVTTANDGFNLPNITTDNRFIRGTNGATLALGLTQTNDNKSHEHNIDAWFTNSGTAYSASNHNRTTHVSSGLIVSGSTVANSAVDHSGGTEARPNAIALIPYVRMEDASSTIVGKFENINSTKIATVTASGNGGNSLSAGQDIVFNEIKDDENQWNGTNFTPVRSGRFVWSGFITSDVANAGSVYLNSPIDAQKYASILSPTSTRYRFFYVEFDLLAGQSAQLRMDVAVTLTNSTNLHFMTIRELPDYVSVIANLSNQKTKCQTKFLSANVTANGVISEWVFDNLVIGKKYSYSITPKYTYSSSSLNDKRARIDLSGAFTYPTFSRWWAYGQAELNYSTASIQYFVATSTTLTPTLFELANAHIAGSTNISTGASIATLCELPDTYVETTEF